MILKNILIRYWWFIILIIIASFFLFSNLNSETLKSKEINFSISNAEKITEIIIVNQSDTISLLLSNEEWLVNNQFPARIEAVNQLLLALLHIRATAPIPLSGRDSLMAVIDREGTDIRVFSGKRKLKSFKLLRTQAYDMDVIGILNRASNAYRMELQGNDGDILGIFSTDSIYWQSKQLGMPHFNNIAAVEVEIPEKPELSYRIDVLDDKTIRFLSLYNGLIAFQFDTLKVRELLLNISQLTYKERLKDLSREDVITVLMMEPEYIFIIYPMNGKSIFIRVFPIPVEEYFDEFGRPIRFDLNNLYININNTLELFKVSYIDYYPVLKDIYHFTPKF